MLLNVWRCKVEAILRNIRSSFIAYHFLNCICTYYIGLSYEKSMKKNAILVFTKKSLKKSTILINIQSI